MSNRLNLDYVDQEIYSLDRGSPWSIAIFFLGLLVAVIVLDVIQKMTEEQAQTELMLSQKKAQYHQGAEKNTPKTKKTYTEVELKLIRNTLSDLGTPWEPLLSGLESINMGSVALLLFEPNKKKQQILLTGQAKNIQSMLQYVEAVSALPMLSKVYLQNHLIDIDDPNKPVTFTIAARWQ